MKKRLFAVLFASLLLFVFAGCTNFNTKLEDAVSEIHEKVLFGKTEDFEVVVTIGKIENDFALEGKKNTLKDFVFFNVSPLGDAKYEMLGLAFRYNDKSEEYDLLQSPKLTNWTLTIDGTMETDTLEVVVFDADEEFVVSTQKVYMGDFNPLDKLKEKFKNELMNTYGGGKFNCEVTMRFVKSRHSENDKFFWFVVVHTGQNEFFGLMIDAETGSVLSQRN